MEVAKLPNLDHFTIRDYDNFYEPSDDTFLMCDTLLQDLNRNVVSEVCPHVCLEIGYWHLCDKRL